MFPEIFVALCIFALVFFFVLLYPYTETLIKKYYVTVEANEIRNASLVLEGIVNAYQSAQNGTRVVETDIAQTPQDIQNISITRNDTIQFGKTINLSNNTVGNVTDTYTPK